MHLNLACLPFRMLPTFLVVATSIAALPAAACADQVILPALKDSTLFADDEGRFANGSGENIFIGATANQSSRRVCISFNLSSIPAGSTITAATLRLTVNRSVAITSMRIDLYRLTADWGEGASNSGGPEGAGTNAAAGDATWLHKFFPNVFWTTAGGDFAELSSGFTTVPTGSTGNHSWVATQANANAAMLADLQAWRNGTAPNFGWVMIGDEGGLKNARRYASRTALSAAARPQLTITFTPPPAPTCLADLVGGDGNPPRDGNVDGNDFQAFLNAFGSGDALADIVGGDGNPPADGSVDGNDFQAFLNAFAAGC